MPHPGLVAAIATTLPGAAWQRCRTHFMRNLLSRVPRPAQPLVAALVRTIYSQPDADSTRRQPHRLRGMDAIHVASALEVAGGSPGALSFVRWDHDQRDAARREGLAVTPEEL